MKTIAAIFYLFFLGKYSQIHSALLALYPSYGIRFHIHAFLTYLLSPPPFFLPLYVLIFHLWAHIRVFRGVDDIHSIFS